jgi:O-antigen/teichoic acid export membrane protein
MRSASAGAWQEFVAALLGSKWHSAAMLLAALALVSPLRMVCAFQNTAATAAGVPEAATKELTVASIALPFAIMVGVSMNGLQGAACAWLIVSPPIYLLSNWLTAAALGLRWYDGLRALAAPAFSGALMFAVIWLVGQWIGPGQNPFVLLIAKLAAGALTYGLALCVTAPAATTDAAGLLRELAFPRRTTV